jgi:ACS family tartrate transporter-like MFS transporter
MSSDVGPLAAKRIVRKIMIRVIPLTFFLYIVAFLDRVNLGYAALQMNKELVLSSGAFGFAAGIFFVGNVLFEVPSSVLLLRYGPRKWIARIILTWGIVATAMAFVQNAPELYILRFILGVAEAGFIPAIVFYYSLWFRAEERASVISMFLLAMPITYLFGAPISTALMEYMHFGGISGWRWMLFVEGLPAVIGGVICYVYLTDSPEDARWLSRAEKDWLAREFERERTSLPHVKDLSVRQAVKNPAIMLMSTVYFLAQVGTLGIGYWLPQIVRNFSARLSLTQVGLIAGFPFIITAIAMIVWSRLSDRLNERKLFTVLPLTFGAIGMLMAGTVQDPFLSMIAITVALACIYAFKPPFLSMINQFVTRPAVAVSNAVIVAIGNFGGFVGPYMTGLMAKATHSPKSGLFLFSGAFFAAAVLTVFIGGVGGLIVFQRGVEDTSKHVDAIKAD